MNPSVAKPTTYLIYQPWGLQTLPSVPGFVVFHHSSTSKPNQLQENHIWVCANLPPKNKNNSSEAIRVGKKLELIKWSINGIVSPGYDGSFSPSVETNRQNSVRDVVQSQIQNIAISEAIQQAHHNNRAWRKYFLKKTKWAISYGKPWVKGQCWNLFIFTAPKNTRSDTHKYRKPFSAKANSKNPSFSTENVWKTDS